LTVPDVWVEIGKGVEDIKQRRFIDFKEFFLKSPKIFGSKVLRPPH